MQLALELVKVLQGNGLPPTRLKQHIGYAQLALKAHH